MAAGLIGALRGRFTPAPVILLYHRVTVLASDPQLLAVSPANFEEHLKVIRDGALALSGIPGLVEGGGKRGGVAVTFDDGYADNLHEAKPLLERHGVPATVFVSSGKLDSAREFWWDDLERVFLLPGALPDRLTLHISGHERSWTIGERSCTEADFNRHRSWDVLRRGKPPTSRHRAYMEAAALLKQLGAAERDAAVSEIVRWAGLPAEGRGSHRALSESELKALAGGGLVEIGGHTVNHPMLSALPPEAQAGEITMDKARLEGALGRRVEAFSYPFGGAADYGADAVRAVKGAGYAFACSNVPGKALKGSDRFQLPRFLVRDWSGAEFAHRLSGFLRSGASGPSAGLWK